MAECNQPFVLCTIEERPLYLILRNQETRVITPGMTTNFSAVCPFSSSFAKLISRMGGKEKRSFEPRHETTNVLVSDLVQHKPGCTATEDC